MMLKNQVNKLVAPAGTETESETVSERERDNINGKTAKVFNSIFSGILLSNFSFARHLLNIYAIMMCLNL